jgi:hypothetical protein
MVMDNYKSDDVVIAGSIDNNTLDTIILSDTWNDMSSNNFGTVSIDSSLYGSNTGYITTTNGTSGYNYSINTPWVTVGDTGTSTGLKVSGDADFEGDVKIKGKSLNEFMETLEKRLAILQPDPAKLEKFEALKKAYNHYKMLEALCEIEDNDKEK